MASSTATGARVVFKMNGVDVAYANSLNYTKAHAHQPVDVLGQPEPLEYGETGYTINFTCTMFRVNTKGAQSQGLMPSLQDLMRQPELSCTMVDKVTGGTLWQIDRVKCTQEDFSVDARNLSQLVLSFVGITHTESDSTKGTNRDDALKTNGITRTI